MASEWMASEKSDTGTPPKSGQDESGKSAASHTENSPTRSPWWTAPAGRPVPIPAFGRGLLEVLLDLLMPKPAPVLVPVKVRDTRRR